MEAETPKTGCLSSEGVWGQPVLRQLEPLPGADAKRLVKSQVGALMPQMVMVAEEQHPLSMLPTHRGPAC